MKEIRFTELVKSSGNPQTAVVFTSPKQDKTLAKAIRGNRVLTVVQRPTGTAKDFGLIGFHQQEFALYLIFPQPLPKEPEARIIGIKYELIKELEAKTPPNPKPAKAVKKVQPVAKPVVKEFEVLILRVATLEEEITVKAQNIADAENQALQIVKRKRFTPSEVQAEIKSIKEV